MADRAEAMSKGVTDDLTTEDEAALANFLSKVQGQQFKNNDMTLHPNPNNATENQLLSIPNVNLNDFDSKSAADPTDLATMDKF